MLAGVVSKYRLFRWWWKTSTESQHGENDFAAKLRISRDDDRAELELLLVNDASVTAWVEEAKVVLTSAVRETYCGPNRRWSSIHASFPQGVLHKILQRVIGVVLRLPSGFQFK